jgi:hypothetical protein
MRKTKRFDVGGLSDEVGKQRVFDPTTNMERQLQIDFEQRRKEDQEARAIRDKGGRGLGIEEINTGDKTPARTNTYEYQGKAVAPTAPLPQAKRIITKEQMAAKGFTNLTDYLNDERKLKPRAGLKTANTPVANENQGDVNAEFTRKLKGLYTPPPAAAAPKKESAKDVTAEIDKNVKSKGFEDALSYALPAAAGVATAGALYKYGTKGLMKKVADKFTKSDIDEWAIPASQKYSKSEPYLASKAEEFTAGAARSNKLQSPAERAIEAQRTAARNSAQRSGEGRSYSEYKKGGKVKSASARADGCAIRGKTRA